MTKFLLALLLSSISFQAFASNNSSDAFFDEDTYVCWAKDFENIYNIGYEVQGFENARESALLYCRMRSIEPNTCKVAECTNLSWEK